MLRSLLLVLIVGCICASGALTHSLKSLNEQSSVGTNGGVKAKAESATFSSVFEKHFAASADKSKNNVSPKADKDSFFARLFGVHEQTKISRRAVTPAATTVAPSKRPTAVPSLARTTAPSVVPTVVPTTVPSAVPSTTATLTPTSSPNSATGTTDARKRVDVTGAVIGTLIAVGFIGLALKCYFTRPSVKYQGGNTEMV